MNRHKLLSLVLVMDSFTKLTVSLVKSRGQPIRHPSLSSKSYILGRQRLTHFVCAHNFRNVSILGVSIFGVPIFDRIFSNFFGPKMEILKLREHLDTDQKLGTLDYRYSVFFKDT